MKSLKQLNRLGLVFLLGSTFISSSILFVIMIVKGLFTSYAYEKANMNSQDYVFLNISFVILGLILIIHDLKNTTNRD